MSMIIFNSLNNSVKKKLVFFFFLMRKALHRELNSLTKTPQPVYVTSFRKNLEILALFLTDLNYIYLALQQSSPF